jgi:CheY-like chemotaxis protein
MARIVVVDDAREFTDLVGEVLREEGHEVVGCTSGVEALSCILTAHPDLVLLDLRLEGQQETGWVILDQLHAHPRTAAIPVIVSSAALDSLQSRELWLQERGIPTLPKPFDLDDLLDLVETVLEQSGSGDVVSSRQA